MFEIKTAVVRTTLANVREEPSQRSELYTQLLFGQEVLIIESEGKWFKCKTFDKSSGWIRKGYLHINQEYSFFHEAEEILIVDEFISAGFEKPDETSAIMIKLLNGSRVMPTGKVQDGYIELATPPNKTCWIRKEHCCQKKSFNSQNIAQQIITEAKAYLGTPYLWGGTSPFGIDCSGLVQQVYGMYELTLPRNASQQASCGEEIATSLSLEEVKPGDLLFFSEGKGVDHVAISLGGSEVIHASFRNGCVAIESLDYDAGNFASFLRACYHSARRVLD